MYRGTVAWLVFFAASVQVFAGDLKTHVWSGPPEPTSVCILDVILDVGFYIHVIDQTPIEVVQSEESADPYHTYLGCKTILVSSNFNALLTVSAVGTDVAGGQWSASIDPHDVGLGKSKVKLCVLGKDVKIENLQGSAGDAKVAEVSISVVPR